MKLTPSTLLAAVLSFGLASTAALMFISFHYLVQTEQDNFNQQAKDVALQFEEELEDVRDEIRGISTIFYAMDHIDSDTLHINSRHTFSQHHTVQKILFAQLVRNQQRSHFEANQHEAGFISFMIHDLDAPNVAVPRQKTYLPITQVEPFDVDNVMLLGGDLFTANSILKTIHHAIATGKDVSVMTNLGDEQPGIWLFKALYSGYSGSSDPYFIKHSQEMLNGMVGLKADVKAFVHKGDDSSINISLGVQGKGTGSNRISIMQEGELQHPSVWAGLHTANHFIFPLSNQDIVLDTMQTLSWFAPPFLLFYLSCFIGLAFTTLLVYSTRIMLESERRNSAILKAALDAIISVDERGSILEFNPAAERIFGYAGKDIIGHDLFAKIIPEPQRQAYRAALQHYLASDEEHVLDKQLEAHALKANGEIFPVELNIVEVVTGKHRIFTVFLRDISVRQQAQYELARLATVVKQSFNAIIITDTQGIIQYVNPAFEHMSGFSAEEALGQRPNIVKSDEHSDQYYADMWKTITAGYSWKDAFINRNKAGNLYQVEQSIAPLILNGECVGYASVQQDVTERKRLQAQSEHTQRLESLGVLAGGIAHDFNNLLSVIMGNVGLAQNKLAQNKLAQNKLAQNKLAQNELTQNELTQNKAEQKALEEPVSIVSKELANIQAASKNAATLCQQMLAYSGQGKFIIQALNLSNIISDLLPLLESSISKRAKLNVHLDADLPAIEADKGQIQQVIMNLIINASEAIADHDGHIHVTATQQHLHAVDMGDLLGSEALSEGDYVHLQIQDDGCGMNEETQARMFDPFFTTKFTGRGLGMSAILGIVRAHSGGIKVASLPNHGTCFDIYFPATEALCVQNDATMMASTPQQLKQGKVLVVDDEELLREIAQSIFEEIDLKTIQAEDGLQAIELLQRDQQHEISLVLLDMTMPKMGGEACYNKLRSFAPDLPVIICSGYAEQEVRQHFTTSQCIDFLQKPYLPEQLIAKAQAMLDASR